jgi:hypothetical protein
MVLHLRHTVQPLFLSTPHRLPESLEVISRVRLRHPHSSCHGQLTSMLPEPASHPTCFCPFPPYGHQDLLNASSCIMHHAGLNLYIRPSSVMDADREIHHAGRIIAVRAPRHRIRARALRSAALRTPATPRDTRDKLLTHRLELPGCVNIACTTPECFHTDQLLS